jgi:hypothetical protein
MKWTSSAPNNCSNKHQNYIAPTWAEVAASSYHIPPANTIITTNLKGTLTVHYDIQKNNIGVSSQYQHLTKNLPAKGNRINTIVNGFPNSHRQPQGTTHNKK